MVEAVIAFGLLIFWAISGDGACVLAAGLFAIACNLNLLAHK